MAVCTDGLILCYCYRLHKGWYQCSKTSLEKKKSSCGSWITHSEKKKYSCKLVRAWRGIISVSFHIYAHAAKPICLHLPTILTVNKVVRPYDIVMNKVKVLDDPVNPLLETSLNPFRVGSSDLLLMFLIKHYNDITLSHSWYLSCNDWVK